MGTHHYTVIPERQPDGGYHAYCPSRRGCHSQGDSVDGVFDNMREAMEGFIESIEAHGEPSTGRTCRSSPWRSPYEQAPERFRAGCDPRGQEARVRPGPPEG